MAVALLSLDAVTRRHSVGRDAIAVLDGVSLDVWPGEVVALRGMRRQGKTTLLRVVAGVEVPDGGSVRLDGEDLGSLPASARTRRLRQIGYAPKEWRVARGKPVLDHVALPLLADGRPLVTALAQAYEAIERVGAADCASAATHELSAGDLARVSLARALVRNPRLLLADEPGVLAGVAEREAILQLLRSIAAERPQLALVLTSRDVAGVSGATRVLAMGDGGVRGPAEQAEVVPLPVRSRHQPAPVP